MFPGSSVLAARYEHLSNNEVVCAVRVQDRIDIHEYCYDHDGVTGEEGAVCKSYCDTDSSCKGYDFKNNDVGCIIYTTSSCPNGFFKHERGNTGEFIPGGYSLPGWSGCYKKIRS